MVTDALAEEWPLTWVKFDPPKFPGVTERGWCQTSSVVLALGADGVALKAARFDSVQFKVNST